ncbi:E3 ubiquitin-protein ligase TRIM11-like isoform X3 [Cyprinus carpio]|uniref:E3 ubiquitin-protein ligase TRIM11-like isoform X3 n=1 Tax=Cyprinus carpio TaxID=7962 RepID=A0A9Q9YF60_CYPCA|nr:E3 ubiquitin-protein ligase TRIM11-like isoform X3 [Cyprinus carpio]
MAEVSFSQDQFSCPVCLDLLKDPVAIPCGHSYCMSCITECWDQKDQKGVYSCPQCRQTFTPRPALNKNTILAEVVEQLKKTKLQAGPENVESDVCTRRKCKSVKSRQVVLEERKRKFQHRIQQRQKDLEELKEASFQSLAVYPESADEPNITVSSLLSYDDLRKSVSQLKEKLEDFCQEEIEKISGRVTCVEINPTNEPKIREEFLQCDKRSDVTDHSNDDRSLYDYSSGALLHISLEMSSAQTDTKTRKQKTLIYFKVGWLGPESYQVFSR